MRRLSSILAPFPPTPPLPSQHGLSGCICQFAVRAPPAARCPLQAPSPTIVHAPCAAHAATGVAAPRRPQHRLRREDSLRAWRPVGLVDDAPRHADHQLDGGWDQLANRPSQQRDLIAALWRPTDSTRVHPESSHPREVHAQSVDAIDLRRALLGLREPRQERRDGHDGACTVPRDNPRC
jgi:hypothetical protein